MSLKLSLAILLDWDFTRINKKSQGVNYLTSLAQARVPLTHELGIDFGGQQNAGQIVPIQGRRWDRPLQRRRSTTRTAGHAGLAFLTSATVRRRRNLEGCEKMKAL